MRLRSIALPAAAAALALAGLVPPAQAAPTAAEPMVGVLLPEQITVIEGKTKTVRAEVVNAGDATAKGVVVKFAGVDPALRLTLPAGCDASSCVVGDLAPEARRILTFTVAPTGAELTSTFEVSVGEFATEVTVVRAKAGVDLELAPIDDMKLGRGQSADVPVLVRNAGSEAVDAIGVLMIVETGLEALTRYRNCETVDEEINGVVCLFEQNFPAGAAFTVPDTTPLRVKVAADAGGPYAYSAAVVAVGVNETDTAALAGKTGPVLRLQTLPSAADVTDGEAPEDINDEDNVAAFGVTVPKSAADSVAVGGSFAGAVGDTKTVQVGVRNLGPTAVIPGSPTWFPTVRVTVPTGVDLTRVDETCAAGTDLDGVDFADFGRVDGRDYICIVVDRLGKGDQALFAFTGKIADGPYTAGSVVADGGRQDTRATNDKAALTVQVTGAGAGTDTGGQGGGGGLAVTGAPAGWIALGGALLLVVGGVLLAVTRRQRVAGTR